MRSATIRPGMQRPNAPILHVFVLMLGLLAVPLGVLLWRQVFETMPADELAVLRLVHRQLGEEFVETRDPKELMLAAIQGMVKGIDRHGEFVVPKEVAAFEAEQLEGTYEGIGVMPVPGVAPITVQSPLSASPAERVGLQVGDRILAVDGKDLSAVSPDDAAARAAELLRGPAGSKVSLRIARGDAEPFDVEIERGNVPEPKVKWARLLDREARLGYVFVVGFQRGVADELIAAVRALETEAGGSLGGLIVDLRFNGGGILTEAVTIANAFLREGRIVSLHRRDVEIERHDARADRCHWPELPLVVLVNERSASASEVLTGALQDHARAVVVGTKTYGKASVQSIFSFRNRAFRLKITTARYQTPKGRDIDGEGGVAPGGNPHAPNGGGIAPDQEAPIDRALFRRLENELDAPEVPAAYRTAVAALAERLGFTPRRAPGPELDLQLAKALDALRKRVAEASGR